MRELEETVDGRGLAVEKEACGVEKEACGIEIVNFIVIN